MKDRLSTRNILRRKQMNLESFNCVFCTCPQEETTNHLFWHCIFAHQLMLGPFKSRYRRWRRNSSNDKVKDQLLNRFFMTAITRMCWTIWIARNEIIFNNNQLNIQQCKDLFFKEMKLVSLRVKADLSADYNQWIKACNRLLY